VRGATHSRCARALARAAVLGAAVVALTGCLRADFGVVVNDDESGEMNMRMVFNREQIEAMTEMFEEFDPSASTVPTEDICAEMISEMTADSSELPEGATVEPIEEDDGWCGAAINIPFDDLEEFSQIAAEMSEGTEDDEVPTGAMALTKTNAGGYRFEVTNIGMSSEALGTTEEDAAEMGEVFEQMLDDMRITYDVRLPGNPVDHNADVVDGNRFFYELRFGDERADLFAETAPGEPDGSADTGDDGALPDEPGGGGSGDGAAGDDAGDDDSDEAGAPGAAGDDDDGGSNTWIWIVVGVLVLAAIVAAVVLLKRRSGSPQPPVPGQPSPGYVPPAAPVDGGPTIIAGPAAATPPPPPPVAPPPPPAEPDGDTGWAPPGSS